MTTSHALIIAAKNGYLHDVQDLLEKGHSVKSRDRSNATALYWGARYGNNDICKELLRYGADVDARISSGSTPLHAACDRGMIDCVKTLLQNGSDVNSQNQRQDTPLHLAAYRGHRSIIEQLMKYGANPDIINAKHKMAEQEAEAEGYNTIGQIIRDFRRRNIEQSKSERFHEDIRLNDLYNPKVLKSLNPQQEFHFANTPDLLCPYDEGTAFSWDGTSHNRQHITVVKSDLKSTKSLSHMQDSQAMKLQDGLLAFNKANFVGADCKISDSLTYIKNVSTNDEQKMENDVPVNVLSRTNSHSDCNRTLQRLLTLSDSNNIFSNKTNCTYREEKMQNIENSICYEESSNSWSSKQQTRDDGVKKVTWDAEAHETGPRMTREHEILLLKKEVLTLARNLQESKDLNESLKNELQLTKDKLHSVLKSRDDANLIHQTSLLHQSNANKIVDLSTIPAGIPNFLFSDSRLVSYATTASSAEMPYPQTSLVSDTSSINNSCPTASTIAVLGELCQPSSDINVLEMPNTLPDQSAIPSSILGAYSLSTGCSKVTSQNDVIYYAFRQLFKQNILSVDNLTQQARLFRDLLRRYSITEEISLDTPGREWLYGVDYQVVEVLDGHSQHYVMFKILHKLQRYLLKMFLQDGYHYLKIPRHRNVLPELHHFTSSPHQFKPVLSTDTHSHLLSALPHTADLIVLHDHEYLPLSHLLSHSTYTAATSDTRDRYLLHLLYQLLSALSHISLHECFTDPLIVAIDDDFIPLIDSSHIAPLNGHQAALNAHHTDMNRLGDVLWEIIQHTTTNLTLQGIVNYMMGNSHLSQSNAAHQLMIRIGIDMFGPKTTTVSSKSESVAFYLSRVTKCLCDASLTRVPTARLAASSRTLQDIVASTSPVLETLFFSQLTSDEFYELSQISGQQLGQQLGQVNPHDGQPHRDWGV